MENRIYFIAFICLNKSIYAQDVPGFIPNIQTTSVGTVVLPMIIANQSDANMPSKFNLKVYGLAVQLLNKGYNLKWVIRTGKLKDGIDFSASAERIWPNFVASAKNFRAGALILFPQYSKTVVAMRTSEKGLTLFPNPASDKLNITLPADTRGWKIQIADCLGKTVKVSSTVTGMSVSFSLENFTNGIYYVTALYDMGIQLKEKFIVNRATSN